MDLNLDGKTVMVGAASAGLGYGIAHALAKEGAHLSIASRSIENSTQAANSIANETGAIIKAYAFDATDNDSIQNWTESTLQDFGSIDGLVVNSGGPKPGKFDTCSDQDWLDAYHLTLLSSVRMIRSVLPTMRSQGSGSIVTSTSMSVKEPIDILLLSNVFRSGVVSLVKSLADDLAAENIRINNLVPGRMDTERVQSVDKINAQNRGVSYEQQRADQQAMIPIGRYGSPNEYGKAAAFLLSDAASYITGSTMTVDGGKTRTVW